MMDARVHDQQGLSSREKMRWKTENGSDVRVEKRKSNQENRAHIEKPPGNNF
jgi:hypothetical protein